MEGLVNALAFPAPKLPSKFYERKLLLRDDLVWLETSAGERIPAVHFVKKQCNTRSQEPLLPGRGLTILYSHGNAEDIALILPVIEALSLSTGSDVFSYEYVGYSLSRSESASEAACYRSIDAAWRYLTVDCGLAARDIVVFGRSIGSGPSVDLVSRDTVTGCSASPRDARALFLQSPIESAIRCALGYFVSLTLYSLDIFRSYEKMALVECPVAVIHGTDDPVAPLAGGKALHEAAGTAFTPLWITGRGHNDIPDDRLFAYLRRFLTSNLVIKKEQEEE